MAVENVTAPLPTHMAGTVDGRRLPRDEADAWVDGSVAGVTGAAVVALFFLAVDLAQGVPFRPPGLLGTELFLGRPLPPDSAPLMAVAPDRQCCDCPPERGPRGRDSGFRHRP